MPSSILVIEIDRLLLVAVFVPSQEHSSPVDRESSYLPLLLFGFRELSGVARLTALVAFGLEGDLLILFC